MTNATNLEKKIKQLESAELRSLIEAMIVELGNRAMKGYEDEPRENSHQRTKDHLIAAMDEISEAFDLGTIR